MIKVHRVRVNAKNISFAKLGYEECEACEYFELHDHTKENKLNDCDTCVHWKNHTESRELYRRMVGRNSADLEEIIVLPLLKSNFHQAPHRAQRKFCADWKNKPKQIRLLFFGMRVSVEEIKKML
ncbi:hypothetical protein JTB14_021946 [Gonioctena quinquepunctata]|nr:hypothetical protein JTB14_021946 [Gonioctena quinquepunctata]